MFSQRNEEKYILDFFKDKTDGTFLDIGAYDGKTFSNTRQLALNGWTGVFVEPCPEALVGLRNLYGKDPRYKIIEKGIGWKTGHQKFYNFGGDAVGSFDVTHMRKWEGHSNPIKEMSIEVITPIMLLASIDNSTWKFDFLNLDIEGWSVQVLEKFPIGAMPNLSMICVEFDHQERRIIKHIAQFGFELLHKTAENLILIRKV